MINQKLRPLNLSISDELSIFAVTYNIEHNTEIALVPCYAIKLKSNFINFDLRSMLSIFLGVWPFQA